MSRYINLKQGAEFTHNGEQYRVVRVLNQFVTGEHVSILTTVDSKDSLREWTYKEYAGTTGGFPEVRYSHVCGWIYDKGAE